MRFSIHGHACIEVQTANKSLICDPWLVGSTYWRSWWNYPPLKPDILTQIDPDYIYLSHIHWDHFHGPTLKKIGLDKPIIIPKIPQIKLYQDLHQMGAKNIMEIAHGETIKLGENLAITSYQFMPILSDSVLIISAEGQVIFNCNDAKIMGLPLQQILRRHSKIDFVLRSHSSANSRLCYEIIDEADQHIDNLDKYSEEFALFAQAVKAEYAIPFASNQCYLHPETLKFNQYNNYAHKVQEYFQVHQIKHPECVVMAPGDSWDSETGFHLEDNKIWYEQQKNKIEEYQNSKKASLAKSIAREKKTKLNLKLAENYAQWLLQETPWFVRLMFKNHPITIIGESEVETKGLYLDIYQQTYSFIDTWDEESNPIQIYVNNAVINDVWAKRHWNSLGVSKRLRIRVKRQDIRYYTLFNELNNALELGSVQTKYILTARYLGAWLKRWREIVLYVQIIVQKLLRRPFSYQNYLPLQLYQKQAK